MTLSIITRHQHGTSVPKNIISIVNERKSCRRAPVISNSHTKKLHFPYHCSCPSPLSTCTPDHGSLKNPRSLRHPYCSQPGLAASCENYLVAPASVLTEHSSCLCCSASVFSVIGSVLLRETMNMVSDLGSCGAFERRQRMAGGKAGAMPTLFMEETCSERERERAYG